MGKKSEEGGSEESIEADARVCGGRGVGKVARTARQHQGRGDDHTSVLSVHETGTGEEMVCRRIMRGYWGVVLGDGTHTRIL